MGCGVAAKTADRPDVHSMPIGPGCVGRRFLGVKDGHQTVTSSWAGRAAARSRSSVGLGWIADCRRQVRRSTIDAGHAPNRTYSHWFTPTRTASTRNHFETMALSAAAIRVIAPASANRTRSKSQREEGGVSMLLL